MSDQKQIIWLKCKNELIENKVKPIFHQEQVLTVPSFQLDDDWTIFLSRLEKYFIENNVKTDRQVPVLLTSIGEPVYDVLKKLCRPELPKKKSFKQLISLLSKHFSQKNVWKERIKFYKLKQVKEDGVLNWFDKVKSAASDCDFGPYLDESIKNKFICGMRTGPLLELLCDEECSKSSVDLLHLALAKESHFQVTSLSQPINKGITAVEASVPVRQSPRRLPLENLPQYKFQNFCQTNSHSKSNRPYHYDSYRNGPGTGADNRGRDDKRGKKRPYGGDDNDDDTPAPTCLCGLSAKRLTVRREGPNQGRDFFVCPKDDGKCSLYTWADEVLVGIQCFCNLTAKKMTVRKDGPNQGRQFYACPRNHGEPDRCQFFVWADEAESGESRRNNSGPGRGGGGGSRSSFGGSGSGSGWGARGNSGPSSAKKSKAPPKTKTPSKFKATGGKEAPKVRKCGVCGQPGHNRKNCPQMAGD